MTEDDARQWVERQFGGAAVDALDHFGRIVVEENARQNLIAPATVPLMWTRHVLDSVQLAKFAPATNTRWLDVGTGAGFPGLALAIILPTVAFTLAEPRRRRADFLRDAASTLNLANVEVKMARAQALPRTTFATISARAVATIDDLLEMTQHLRSKTTTYILPRGRIDAGEVETLGRKWQGLFHVEQSVTEPSSSIVIASGVP